MTYDNPYNRMIAQKVRQIDQNHVDRINQISDTNTHDITSPLEGMTLRSSNIQGGSGFAAATIADLGFEPTNGATHTASGAGSSGGKMRRSKAKAKSQGGGISGGALLTDASADNVLRPQPPPGIEARVTLTASPHKNQPIPRPSQGTAINGALASGSVEVSGSGISGGGSSGGGVGSGVSGGSKKVSARNVLVRQIMKEKGLSLPNASKYIKEHGLYKK